MTISDATLEQAVARGVVTGAQVAGLRDIERELGAASGSPADDVDDEKLRFVSGFGDIFVTIGLALFLNAAAYFVASAGGLLAMWIGLAVLAWLLAEFFTRQRRMALPSIVLLLVFAVSCFVATANLAGYLLGVSLDIFGSSAAAGSPERTASATAFTIAGLATAALTAVHYWRFRTPITIAAGVAALAGVGVALVSALAPDFADNWMRLIVFVIGLMIFALAMHFDMSDRERVTRRADIAFWLHLLAAPMIVHPLVAGMFGDAATPGAVTAISILLLFALLGLVAVLIDRRALLVSGLSYAGIAFASLLRATGIADQTVPLTLLALGAFVLLLSAGWHPLRRAAIALLPTPVRDRLPVAGPAPVSGRVAG